MYFAGHGLEWEQGGFLIPVGLETADGQTVSYKALSVQRLLSDLQHAPGLKLILLDACRTRPRGRGAGGGLPALTPPEGLFLHYATRAMQVALEFPGQRNGVYASGLLRALNNVCPKWGEIYGSYCRNRKQCVAIESPTTTPGTLWFLIKGKSVCICCCSASTGVGHYTNTSTDTTNNTGPYYTCSYNSPCPHTYARSIPNFG